jgi:polysaccharide biosynthesis transport protein
MSAPQTARIPETLGEDLPSRAPREPLKPENPGIRIDVGASVKRHWILASLTFFLIAFIGLAVSYVKGAPKYSATAVVFISPRFIANLEDNKEFDLQSNTQYREYVQQNVRSINRFDIIESALKSLGDRKSLWVNPGEPLSRAVERLQGALKIEPVPDTYQITIALEGGKKDGLAEIVNTVVNTFIEKIKAEELFGSDYRIRNLRTERDQLAKFIAAAQEERSTLAQKLGVSTFTDAFANPYDQLLVDSETALANARRARIQADAQVSALKRGTTNSASALEAYALEITSKDPGLTTLDANLNTRRSALLASISGLSPEHPGRRSAEKELKNLQEERDIAFQKVLTANEQMIYGQKQSESAKAQTIEKGLQADVDSQTAQASAFTRGYQHAIALGLEIDRQRKRLESVEDRISFLSLEGSAPGFVRLFSTARQPDLPIKGGRKVIVLIGLVLALLLAVVVPVGIDFLDPRLHWPGDLERALGLPVMGWLVEKGPSGKEFQREQVLRLANRINRDFETNKSQIFAFTSVKSGNGVTTIVNEAALALTQLGKPTLAVEANAYRADPRYRDPNSRGLTVLLRGQSELASEIVPAGNSRADFLPVGDVSSFANLPDLHNLLRILRHATQVYSIVLVDLPPILVSADAEVVVSFADVAVLVAEAESVTKAEVQRAAKLLERVRPAAVAAVLNRVRLDAAANFGREAQEEFYNGARQKAVWLRWLWK